MLLLMTIITVPQVNWLAAKVAVATVSEENVRRIRGF